MRTKSITLVLVPILVACGPNSDYRHCVDNAGNVVPDVECSGVTGTYLPGVYYPHRWYFAPRLFYPGMHVYGGGYIASTSRVYVPASRSYIARGPSFSPSPSVLSSPSVSRGGFGSSGAHFGGVSS